MFKSIFSERRRQPSTSGGKAVSILRRNMPSQRPPVEGGVDQQQQQLAELERRQERQAFRSLSRTLESVDMTQSTNTPYPDLGAALDSLLKVIEAEEREEDKPVAGSSEAVVIKTEQNGDIQFCDSGLICAEKKDEVAAVTRKTVIRQVEETVAQVDPLIEPVRRSDSSSESNGTLLVPAVEGVQDRQSESVEIKEDQQVEDDKTIVSCLIGKDQQEGKLSSDVPSKARSRKSTAVKKIPREKVHTPKAPIGKEVLVPGKKEVKSDISTEPAPEVSTKGGRGTKDKDVSNTATILSATENSAEMRRTERKRKRPIVEYFILADPSKIKKGVKENTSEKAEVVGKSSDLKRKFVAETEKDSPKAKKRKVVQDVEEKAKQREEKSPAVKSEVRGGRKFESRSENKVGKSSISKSESKRPEIKEECKSIKKAGGGKLKYQDPKLLQVPEKNPYARKVKSFRRRRGGEDEENAMSGEEAFKTEVEHNKKVALLGRIQFFILL